MVLKKNIVLASVIGMSLMAVKASAAVVSYGTAGSAYTENFGVMSNSTGPSTGFMWQNGGATSQNTAVNSATGVTTIAGFYAFYSNVVGAAADISTGGPRNLAGPDQVDPSTWPAVTGYYTTSNSGSRLMSFGIAGTNGVTERAIGTISGSTANNGTNNLSPGDIYMALVLQNTTGQTLNNVSFSYYGERWRDVNVVTSPQGLLFSYEVTPTFSGVNTDIVTATSNDDPASNNNGFGAFTRDSALDFTMANDASGAPASLTTVDGNISGVNRFSLSDTINTTWAPGDYLILRWFDNDENGSDFGMGIDDLSLSAAPAPEPGMVGMGLVVMGLGWRGKRMQNDE